MRRMLLSTTAALLALSGAALAQTATDTPARSGDPAAAGAPQQPMATPVPEKMEDQAQTPATMDAEKPAETARAPEAVIEEQDSQQLLASDMMGARVMGADDERIGEITDLLLDQDRRVVAAVVAVGGFLGIGEKHVAIPFEEFQEAPEAEGFILAMTKEELEQAPAFKTAEDVESERQNQQMQQTPPATQAPPQQ